MKTYSSVLAETVDYYNLKNRSVVVKAIGNGISDSNCLYNGPDGKQCAMGRCCEGIPVQYEQKFASAVMEFLKPEYKHLTDDFFWTQLQAIHDTEELWSDDGFIGWESGYYTEILNNIKKLEAKEDA